MQKNKSLNYGLLSLLLFFISISCNVNRSFGQDIPHRINLDASICLDSLHLSRFCDSLEVIKLDDREEAMIGTITKIGMYNNLILVLDRNVAKSIFVFDRQGRFLTRIGRIGNGPGDYLSITDFVVDENKNVLYVLDNRANKIKCYDINSWNLKKELTVEKGMDINYLALCNGRLYTDCSNPKVAEMNDVFQEISLETGQHLQRYSFDFMSHKIVRKDANMIAPNLFGKKDKELLLTQQYSPIIAFYDGDKVSPLLKVESSSFITHDNLNELQGKKHLEVNRALIGMNKLYNINQVMCVDDLLSFKIQKGLDVRTVVYDTRLHESKVVKLFVNDLKQQDYIPYLGFYTYGDISDDGVCFYLNPTVVGLMEGFTNKRNIAEALRELKTIWNEDHNPHILYFRFKNNKKDK